MSARRSIHEDRQQRNVCRRNCCVTCVEGHVLSDGNEAAGGQCRQEDEYGSQTNSVFLSSQRPVHWACDREVSLSTYVESVQLLQDRRQSAGMARLGCVVRLAISHHRVRICIGRTRTAVTRWHFLITQSKLNRN